MSSSEPLAPLHERFGRAVYQHRHAIGSAAIAFLQTLLFAFFSTKTDDICPNLPWGWDKSATYCEAVGWLQFASLIGAAACIPVLIWIGAKGDARRKTATDQQTEIENLREELRVAKELHSQDLSTIALGFTLSIGNGLAFNDHDRVTIYAFDDESEEFVHVARYSPNPTFRKQGRKRIPKEQGVIWKAWNEGTCCLLGAPSVANGKTGNYVKWHCKHAVPEEVVSGLSMPSRFYYGWRVVDRQGRQGMAVVVVESTEKERFNRQILDRFFREGCGPYIGELLAVSKTQAVAVHPSDRGL